MFYFSLVSDRVSGRYEQVAFRAEDGKKFGVLWVFKASAMAVNASLAEVKRLCFVSAAKEGAALVSIINMPAATRAVLKFNRESRLFISEHETIIFFLRPQKIL